MRIRAGLLAAALFAGPALSYFHQQKKVDAPGGGQHYFIVDETIWKNARPDLGDLRLYSGEDEIPYALVVQRGSLEHDHKDVRVLQQATVAGKTQFMIDMAGVVEYDHIDLNLAAKNFVAHAKVEGQDDLHGTNWALVAEPILYDLSRESLGENSMLRLPLSTYKYLRVTIDGPVKPADVLGASSEFRQEQKAVWRDVASAPRASERGHDSLWVLDVPQNVPVERVTFEIADPNQANFLRQVEITNDKGMRLGGGEISRVHMVRNGNKIDTEKTDVEFSSLGQKAITVTIHNGDDKPLKLTVRLQQYQRRIYFNSAESGAVTLYYGDEKLASPVYDYAKLFQETNAPEARLSAAEPNPAYTGRPDERPWSERHPAVLWIAIIAAVLILGTVALRSMKTAAAS